LLKKKSFEFIRFSLKLHLQNISHICHSVIPWWHLSSLYNATNAIHYYSMLTYQFLILSFSIRDEIRVDKLRILKLVFWTSISNTCVSNLHCIYIVISLISHGHSLVSLLIEPLFTRSKDSSTLFIDPVRFIETCIYLRFEISLGSENSLSIIINISIN